MIKEKKSKKVLFAGKIAKPKFSTLRLDLKGIYYMPSILKAAKLGDAAIIKAIIKILDNENIKVISSISFNPELAVKTGNFTKLKPNLDDMNSIKKGVIYFNKLNSLDHIQALVVNDEKVIAIEGNQGTKKMLSKLKKKSGGILMKLPKKKQDLRTAIKEWIKDKHRSQPCDTVTCATNSNKPPFSERKGNSKSQKVRRLQHQVPPF